MAQTLLKVDNINVFYGNIHAVKEDVYKRQV